MPDLPRSQSPEPEPSTTAPVSLSKGAQQQLSKLVEQAKAALRMKRLGDVERLCTTIEGIQPGNADVANLRAFLAASRGNWEDARRLLEYAVKAEPESAEFHHNLALLYVRHEKHEMAEEHYRDALRCDPDSVEIKLGYCSALVETGKADKALPMLEEMCGKLSHPVVMTVLSLALIQLKRFEEALEYLEKAIAKDANYPNAHFEKAILLMQLGHMDEAEAELRQVLSLQPDHVKAYERIAIMRKCTAGDIQAMEGLYARIGKNHRDRANLCFAMAKAYEEQGQFDKAFGYYEEGNALTHEQSDYDLETSLERQQAGASAFTPEFMRRTSDLEDDRPIFIVGMPRCGSTLVEQILATHPDVSSKGEWDAMGLVFSERSDTGNPLTLEETSTFSSEEWREIGMAYLEKMDQSPPSKRVTDKTLTYYAMLGAIHCALPRARIVHVRRNPLDNCLAIYRTHFISSRFDYGSNLADLGCYYRAYLQIMQHWRKALPEGVMYELDYEQLVANQEEESRKLLAACGLEWNEACLQFNKARAFVETASMTQVRRPMYSEAVGRWKHYEKYLQPLIRILGPDTVESKPSSP